VPRSALRRNGALRNLKLGRHLACAWRRAHAATAYARLSSATCSTAAQNQPKNQMFLQPPVGETRGAPAWSLRCAARQTVCVSATPLDQPALQSMDAASRSYRLTPARWSLRAIASIAWIPVSAGVRSMALLLR
jgi:hypothetical protein